MLATPDAITDPDAPKKMVGSAFILEAESIDQCVMKSATSLGLCSSVVTE